MKQKVIFLEDKIFDLYLYCNNINRLKVNTIENKYIEKTYLFFNYNSIITHLKQALQVELITMAYNILSTYFFFLKFVRLLLFVQYLIFFKIRLNKVYRPNMCHIPRKKHMFVVLRSPHKDKKAREKFIIQRLRKTIIVPTMLFDYNLYNSMLRDTMLLKFKSIINK